jgi:ribosomal protein S18 acetylase RimI-like enzyme
MVEIKQLTPNDFKKWRDLRLESLQNHPENYLSSFEEESKRTDEEWQNVLANNFIVGMFFNSELISIVSLTISPRFKSQHKGEIWGVYTHPNHRGKGCAAKLIRHVINETKNKLHQYILTCTTTNTGAFKIYQQLGFVVYGTESKSIKVKNKYYDEYLMVLDLDNSNL